MVMSEMFLPRDVPYGDGETPVTPPTATPPGDSGNVKKYTESEHKLYLSRLESKYKAEMEATVAELERIREASVAPEVKDELTQQIASLETKYKTSEELAKRERDKLTKQHTEMLTTATKEAEAWKGRFTQMKVQNDIFKAAGDDAYFPEDVINTFGNKLYLDEKSYETRVKMAGEKGEELDLSADEAIKLMKDNVARYGHLFKSTSKSGLGGDKTKGAVGKEGFNLSNPKQFSQQFKEYRKEHSIGH